MMEITLYKSNGEVIDHRTATEIAIGRPSNKDGNPFTLDQCIAWASVQLRSIVRKEYGSGPADRSVSVIINVVRHDLPIEEDLSDLGLKPPVEKCYFEITTSDVDSFLSFGFTATINVVTDHDLEIAKIKKSLPVKPDPDARPTVYRTDGIEPVCPKCKNWNALLYSGREGTVGAILECRDCGHKVVDPIVKCVDDRNQLIKIVSGVE